MNQLISFSFVRVYGSVALSFNNGSALPRMSDVQARLLLVTVPNSPHRPYQLFWPIKTGTIRQNNQKPAYKANVHRLIFLHLPYGNNLE